MNSDDFQKYFRLFLSRRENAISKNPNPRYVKGIYKHFVAPLLLKGQAPDKANASELEKFTGEIFGLSVLEKSGELSIEGWEYQPTILNRYTPDFIVNQNTLVEIYSPIMTVDYDKNSLIGGIQFRELGPHTHEGVLKNLKCKFTKYSSHEGPVIIVVHLLSNGFPNDTIFAIRSQNIPEGYKVYLFHGDKQISIETGRYLARR